MEDSRNDSGWDDVVITVPEAWLSPPDPTAPVWSPPPPEPSPAARRHDTEAQRRRNILAAWSDGMIREALAGDVLSDFQREVLAHELQLRSIETLHLVTHPDLHGLGSEDPPPVD